MEYKKPPNPDKKEMHIPGYNFCGPGTQVEERIKRGDRGVNKLDNACMQHDVDYMQYADNEEKLRESDKKLASVATEILKEAAKNYGYVMMLSNFVSDTLGKFGVKLPFSVEYLQYLNPTFINEKLAAKIVKAVFDNKEGLTKFLSAFGYKTFAKDFAGSLSNDSIEESIKKGKELDKLIN